MINAQNQIVISLNDYGPEEVCLPGTTIDQALARCQQLRETYCAQHPSINGIDIRFHCRSVRIWEPAR